MIDLMIENTILCVKWGDKYDDEYVHNLKKQCMENCSVPFNFYCLTDKKTKSYDITLPTKWDPYYDENSGFFWAYRKCYMFKLNESIDGDFIGLEGNKFLFLDKNFSVNIF